MTKIKIQDIDTSNNTNSQSNSVSLNASTNSDSTTSTVNPTNSNSNSNLRSSKIISYISIALLFLACGYLYNELVNIKIKFAESNLSNLDSVVDIKLDAKIKTNITTALNDIEKNLDNKSEQQLSIINNNINSSIESYKSEVSKLQANIDKLDNSQDKPSSIAQMLTITRIIDLLVANLKISDTRAIDSSLAVLKSLERDLSTSKEQALLDTRKDVLVIIDELSAIESPETINTIALLEQFTNSIDKLKLKDLVSVKQKIDDFSEDKLINKTNNENNNSELDGLNLAVDKIKTVFFDLVKVQKIDNNNLKNILDEHQLESLKIVLKLKATQAVSNLELLNGDLYNKSIQDLKYNTKLYISNNQELQKKLLDLLDKAGSTDINNKDIDWTRIDLLKSKLSKNLNKMQLVTNNG